MALRAPCWILRHLCGAQRSVDAPRALLAAWEVQCGLSAKQGSPSPRALRVRGVPSPHVTSAPCLPARALPPQATTSSARPTCLAARQRRAPAARPPLTAAPPLSASPEVGAPRRPSAEQQRAAGRPHCARRRAAACRHSGPFRAFCSVPRAAAAGAARPAGPCERGAQAAAPGRSPAAACLVLMPSPPTCPPRPPLQRCATSSCCGPATPAPTSPRTSLSALARPGPPCPTSACARTTTWQVSARPALCRTQAAAPPGSRSRAPAAQPLALRPPIDAAARLPGLLCVATSAATVIQTLSPSKQARLRPLDCRLGHNPRLHLDRRQHNR